MSRRRTGNVWVMVLLAPLVLSGDVRAQVEVAEGVGGMGVTAAARIDRLEAMVRGLAAENQRLTSEVRGLQEQLTERQPVAPVGSSPVVASEGRPAEGGVIPPALPDYWVPAVPPGTTGGEPYGTGGTRSRYRVDYENGFAIVPENVDDTPFSLRVRSQDVIRYNGFARGASFWTDSAGTRRTIDNSSYFGIPRGRILFSGNVFFPRMMYLLNIDYNSVTNNPIGFRAYELGYRFSRGFELYAGQTKVPGSREWMESAFAPLQGPDRSMATTFFRPSLSQGVWALGQPWEGVYYHGMVSNGFNTLNLLPERLNNRFCYSLSTWWEPWAPYGRGYSDWEDHEEAAIRLGGSYTYAIGRGSQTESDAVENSPIRLSDGTILTTTGALAPGVTVNRYDISLAAIDLSYKYRGLGLSGEIYYQNLLGLEGTGPLPIRSTRAVGGFLQGGYFLLPRELELYAKTSFVTGRFGSGSEVGGGVNWFILPGNDRLRYTFDATWLESSPAGQNRTGYVAGQTGFLLRTQITIVY